MLQLHIVHGQQEAEYAHYQEHCIGEKREAIQYHAAVKATLMCVVLGDDRDQSNAQPHHTEVAHKAALRSRQEEVRQNKHHGGQGYDQLGQDNREVDDHGRPPVICTRLWAKVIVGLSQPPGATPIQTINSTSGRMARYCKADIWLHQPATVPAGNESGPTCPAGPRGPCSTPWKMRII